MSPTQNPLAAEGTGRTAREAGAVHEDPPRRARAANRLVPDAVVRRFLRSGDRYFFPDRSLAFVDGGTRLRVRSHNAEVVHAVVAIVQARGWTAVRASGAPAFRRQLWHAAARQGIAVRGYRPSGAERRELRQALAPGAKAGQATDSPEAAAKAEAAAGGASQRSLEGGREITGVLLAHAAAPYRFDPAQRMSYYLRLRTEVGERTLWGADLERAVAESRSRVQVGDEVTAWQRGARPVTVRVTQRNDAGERIGQQRLRASRTAWAVEKVRFREALQRKAELVRKGVLPAGALLAADADLTATALALRLAVQFARRLSPRLDEQTRIVAAIREGLAQAMARGDRIRLPGARMRERAAPSAARA